MLTRPRRLASNALLCLALPAGAIAAGLEAGVARVDITPVPGVGMYGFANRKGGATGVLDPLMARVLVLEAGGKRLALVALDLGEPPAGEWIKRLREKAARTSGISCVLVVATHTHSGPHIRDEYPPKQAPDWESPALEKVAQAIDDAHRRRGEARDINPYYAVHPLDQDAVRMRDWTGERLGQEAARVAKSIRTEPGRDATLDWSEDTLDLDWRWNVPKLRDAVRQSWGPEAAAEIERRAAEGLHAPVATVLIDKRIALMTVPGEPFVEHQIDWRNRCPVHDSLFVGYANGSLGYFPSIRAAVLGGYGAANSATYVQPDAGARIVNHAIVRVYEMLGRLRDAPEDIGK